MGDDLNHPLDRPAEGVFYCGRCVKSYTQAEWTILAHWDDHPIGSWYDCAQLQCTRGHERHADLAIFTYRNPNTRLATLGSGAGPRSTLKKFLALLRT